MIAGLLIGWAVFIGVVLEFGRRLAIKRGR